MLPARDPLFTPRFAMLWVYAFVTFFSAFRLLPAIPFRILGLGGSKAEAGWFLSVYTFASAFSAPVMGSLADHFGRRRFLITASILFVASLRREDGRRLARRKCPSARWPCDSSRSRSISTRFSPRPPRVRMTR
jgi:hypothetical protein